MLFKVVSKVARKKDIAERQTSSHAEKPETLTGSKETVKKLQAIAYLGKSNLWIFQADPQRYDS